MQLKSKRDNPLIISVKGAAAGAVGTAVISLGLQYGPKLLQKVNLLPANSPAAHQDSLEPTKKLADMVADQTLDTSLKEDDRKVAGQAIRWTYGIGWGVLFGFVQNWLRLPHLLHGTLLGIISGTVASTLVPALGLTPPPTKQPPAMIGLQFTLHILYGWITALVFQALTSTNKNPD